MSSFLFSFSHTLQTSHFSSPLLVHCFNTLHSIHSPPLSFLPSVSYSFFSLSSFAFFLLFFVVSSSSFIQSLLLARLIYEKSNNEESPALSSALDSIMRDCLCCRQLSIQRVRTTAVKLSINLSIDLSSKESITLFSGNETLLFLLLLFMILYRSYRPWLFSLFSV